jgi:hypothetical protein
MGYSIDLAAMELSVYNIAGAVSIVCFLALPFAVTLDAVTDEEEGTDSEEDFISWLWGFWLLCLLGIVVVLMRLCDGGHDFLYRLSMGNLALQCVLQDVDNIASSRWGSLIGTAIATQFCVRQCLPQSARVTAWFCNAQMLALFCIVAFTFFLIIIYEMVSLVSEEPTSVFEWTEITLLGILTVSCFVVTFLAPPVIILVEEPPDPVAQEQQNDVSPSNAEYQRA